MDWGLVVISSITSCLVRNAGAQNGLKLSLDKLKIFELMLMFLICLFTSLLVLFNFIKFNKNPTKFIKRKFKGITHLISIRPW